ncbi:ATP-dependent zinc protease [Aliivibrio fischeri]|uniref:ATP-dependent Zn protease n=1 Tax=Aliivibrio fischeri (strain MJ11) TaxID=388396 RepID=B5FCP6_ALIFM|nr:ATP-dependent zinc protease [Aliivibrio fischeri]ACH66088.1 ATP-dependent Zn protease [Aliivibrio fischeri MJ11]MCE7534495.1 ATP-dependent zinc protease [Aliivibrio fischeri]MCE7557669.1 ATP-dependent zinc protease [Aliivibrio fischeri]MCE7564660.1 ATP-dependent zinc protease [Aliivibrio fischeri]MCE7576056.1 ATP-dependent zinc protease [Aliivibrio fischeri]
MIQRILPLVAVLSLSGCALTQQAQPLTSDNSETVAAIKSMETNLNTRLDTMEGKIETQNEYISTLEKELSNVSEELSIVRSEQTKIQNSIRVATSKKKRLAPLPVSMQSQALKDTIVLGAIENVEIADIKQAFTARIDTGATTSSLNAVDLQEFERNGSQWVRFHLVNQDVKADDGKLEWITAPVIRNVKIRQATADDAERRPVVELWIKLGAIHEKVQFTLADRSHMTHSVLLGREFIQDIAVVDVSKEFVQSKK